MALVSVWPWALYAVIAKASAIGTWICVILHFCLEWGWVKVISIESSNWAILTAYSSNSTTCSVWQFNVVELTRAHFTNCFIGTTHNLDNYLCCCHSHNGQFMRTLQLFSSQCGNMNCFSQVACHKWSKIEPHPRSHDCTSKQSHVQFWVETLGGHSGIQW